MKKINQLVYTVLIIITINAATYAQSFSEPELIGVWNVVNVEGTIELPDAQKETLEALKKAFMESTFNFEANNRFTLDIDFIGIEDMMQNVYWSFNKENSSIAIHEQKNEGGNLMGIAVEKKNNKIFFRLTESPLTLEVTK